MGEGPAAGLAIPIDSPSILFVEGQWDESVIGGLCRQRKLPQPRVWPIRGKNNYKVQVSAILKEPAFTSGMVKNVGFLRDANGYSERSGEGAFRSLCGLFKALGWREPGDVGQFVVTPGGYRAGIFIVPSRSTSGMLETLCMQALASEPATFCVDKYLDCLAEKGLSVKEHVRDKARLQAFVASTADPQRSLKTLMRETNALKYEHSAYDPLASFLRLL